MTRFRCVTFLSVVNHRHRFALMGRGGNFGEVLVPRCYRSMPSRSVRDRVTCGSQATGPGVPTTTITTGCPERGCSLPLWVCFGLPVIGGFLMASMSGTPATGDQRSAFMAALTMDLATPATTPDAGVAATSITTARSIIRLRRSCCLPRRSDCYRVERSSSRAGLSPAVVQRLSLRTVIEMLCQL